MDRVYSKLPHGWVEISLHELMADTASINPKNTPEKMYELWSVPSFDSNVPEYVTGAEIGSNKQNVSPGDVLLCKINPRINRVWLVKDKGELDQIASTEWIVLRSRALYPPFLLYQLREENFRQRFLVDLSGIGGSLTRARPRIVGQLKAKLAPTSEQKRIVSRIEELQTRSRRARGALEAIPDLLDQLRQSILAAAFRGDLTKEWRQKHPNIEPAAELLKRICTERRKRWEEDELGKLKAKGLSEEKLKEAFSARRKQYKEPAPVDASDLPDLPNGWCWASWKEVGFCQNGRAFPSKHYSSKGIKLLRPGNLHGSGRIEWTVENTRYMPEQWSKEHNAYIVGSNEIIINLTAQSLKDEFLGRVCLTGAAERCLLNQRLARLTPILLSTSFVLWILKSLIFRRYVDTLNTGSLIQHMFTTQIDDFLFPLPPYKEQTEIIDKVIGLMRSKELIDEITGKFSLQLNTLDQSILSKAFRGELVPQDPNDEPAATLLDRIRREKSRAVAATKANPKGKMRKRKQQEK